jgi:hypothetical protein
MVGAALGCWVWVPDAGGRLAFWARLPVARLCEVTNRHIPPIRPTATAILESKSGREAWRTIASGSQALRSAALPALSRTFWAPRTMAARIAAFCTAICRDLVAAGWIFGRKSPTSREIAGRTSRKIGIMRTFSYLPPRLSTSALRDPCDPSLNKTGVRVTRHARKQILQIKIKGRS